MKDIILKAENICYTVDKKPCLPAGRNNFSGVESVEILKNISFEVERGKVIGISGESGSGKSTLAKILTGVYSESSGSLNTFFKKDWKHSLPGPIQILFQNDGNLINPNRKVMDVLNEAFESKQNSKKNYSIEVTEIFNSFGLKEELLNNKGSQLSGGEQQRIALVRIMIVEPEILILDEPFSSQDVEAQLAILELIKKVKVEFGLTIICISHDLKILKHFADEILIMFRGNIVESGNTADIFSKPQNDYTKFLLSAQTLSLSVNEIENFHTRYEQDQRN